MNATPPSPHSTDAKRSRSRRLPSAEDLVRLRDATARARKVAESLAEELFLGQTEVGAARIFEGHLHAAGATGYLVEPRVLFGSRTTLPHGARPGQGAEDARPGWSTLDAIEVYLLEAVPLLGGLPAPVAVCGALGGSPQGFRAGRLLLDDARDAVVAGLKAGASCRDLAQAVGELGRRRGWRDTTRPRAGWTLARRIDRLPAALAAPTAPFGAAALERTRLGAFALRRKAPAGRAPSAVWSDDPAADTPVSHGLWLVSPRFARGSVGVCTRDYLWIDDDGPRWLEDGPLPRA